MCALAWQANAQPVLRVCADPNNLPFSNERREGFENKIVEIIARDLHRSLNYTWWAQRRGFLRNTLNAGKCDLVPGIAKGVDMLATTQAYYRSTYVFVSRKDRKLSVESFDDPQLRHLTIGVQMIGDDFSNTPPAQALSRRGMIDNVRGYTLYGDYSRDSPSRAVVDAVARGEVDIAAVWGPLAGYFSHRESVPLTVTPISESADAGAPVTFPIAMGVRKNDGALREQIDAALEHKRNEIAGVLDRYHVPRLEITNAASD